MSVEDDAGVQVKIGLEMHVYVRTRSKLFCACPAEFLDVPANTNVCPTCTGQPGAKPWLPNAAAVRASLRLAHALGARGNAGFRFLRKHYFYPDLPSNYQRTGEPLAEGGFLGGARLTELHLEEDPGAYDLKSGVVDYNRSGVPLVEVVTEPDFENPEQARLALDELRLALLYLGIGDPALGVKADCNVSVRVGDVQGVRVEVKNVSGSRNVERALAHEIERHTALLRGGGEVLRETRHFDEATGRTVRLRSKETAVDYRFMPDPDLPFVRISPEWVERARLEESPFARRERLAKEGNVAEPELSPLFEEELVVDAYELVHRRIPAAFALQFFLRDLRGELNYRRIRLRDAKITAKDVGDLVVALHAGHLTAHQGTRVLRVGLDEGRLQEALREEVASSAAGGEVEEAARAVVEANPKAVADFSAGKEAAVNFLMGAAMKRLKGRAEPATVREAVRQALLEASKGT